MNAIALRPWSPSDLPLLRRANDPSMTRHLNGGETEEKLGERHARCLRLNASGEARMSVILDDGNPVGSIGFWRIRWRQADALETGWFVLPEAQDRGTASRALELLLVDAREAAGHRGFLVAFPAIANPASNALCRRAGFDLVGTTTHEFRGADLAMNEWALDLARPAEP